MINLLSPTLKEERSYGRRNRSLLGYSLVLLVTAVAIMGIMAGSLQFIGPDESKLSEELEEANIEIALLESSVKPIESVAQRLDTAKELSDLSVEFSDFIPEIGAALPNGVVLNALSLTGGITDPLQLDVDLTSADLVPVLIVNLVEAELFEAADLSNISPKGASDDDENSTRYRFTASVTASFTGSSDLKKKAEAAAKAKAEAAAKAAEEAAE